MRKKKNKNLSKTLSQRIHFSNRFKERYNIDINKEDARQMVGQIQNGWANMVYERTNRISIWKVHHLGVKYDVVYDSLRETLVTVLTNKGE
jgi:hypothetical protein